jgi:hypothetical protein
MPNQQRAWSALSNGSIRERAVMRTSSPMSPPADFLPPIAPSTRHIVMDQRTGGRAGLWMRQVFRGLILCFALLPKDRNTRTEGKHAEPNRDLGEVDGDD